MSILTLLCGHSPEYGCIGCARCIDCCRCARGKLGGIYSIHTKQMHEAVRNLRHEQIEATRG